MKTGYKKLRNYTSQKFKEENKEFCKERRKKKEAGSGLKK